MSELGLSGKFQVGILTETFCAKQRLCSVAIYLVFEDIQEDWVGTWEQFLIHFISLSDEFLVSMWMWICYLALESSPAQSYTFTYWTEHVLIYSQLL